MTVNTSNVPKYVTTAISKAIAVDDSHYGYHKALIALVVAVSKLEVVTALEHINMVISDRVTSSPNSLSTKGTIIWFETHFGLYYNEDKCAMQRGETWTGKGFTPATLEAAQDKSWDRISAELAFKVPGSDLPMKAAAAIALRQFHIAVCNAEEGEEVKLPTKDEVYAAFMNDVATVRAGAGHLKWANQYDKRKANGTLPEAKAKVA